jgi:hypothetical protein
VLTVLNYNPNEFYLILLNIQQYQYRIKDNIASAASDAWTMDVFFSAPLLWILGVSFWQLFASVQVVQVPVVFF